MANESYVQVIADGAGKQVRNLLMVVRTVDPTTGTETLNSRYAQVVSFTDEFGNVVDVVGLQKRTQELLTDIRTELRICNHLLQLGFSETPQAFRGTESEVLRTLDDFVKD